MIYHSREHVGQISNSTWCFVQHFFVAQKVPLISGQKLSHFWASMRSLVGERLLAMLTAVAICLVPWLVEALPKARSWFLWPLWPLDSAFWLQKDPFCRRTAASRDWSRKSWHLWRVPRWRWFDFVWMVITCFGLMGFLVRCFEAA